MAETSRAVFLSYASQDAEVARKICDSLRTAGIEVWFDQSELRGGDAWDRKIRQQIHDCRLFVPIISVHSEARDEGYFRREWKLAVDRTHDMADHKAFLVPVVIDGTAERSASVPDKFRELQWSYLPGGETTTAFVEHIRRLLAQGSPSSPTDGRQTADGSGGGERGGPVAVGFRARFHQRSSARMAITALIALTAVGGTALWLYSRPVNQRINAGAIAASTLRSTKARVPEPIFNPPAHSIAVLPFINLSGDPKQDYFSDGISEELINALSRIRSIEVIARTSSFSFKGQNVDARTIAHRLNVGAILEGSVRRSGNTVRVTAQLIDATTGFDLWSQDYDRRMKNILELQSNIATAVARKLQAKLGVDVRRRITLGGTSNADAYDHFLRGQHLESLADPTLDEAGYRAALAQYNQAIVLDPNYALAYAAKAGDLAFIANFFSSGDSQQRLGTEARAAAERAIALAPELGEAHRELGLVLAYTFLNFNAALPEFERALALSPGSWKVESEYGTFEALLGHANAAISASATAIRLDPENIDALTDMGQNLIWAHRFEDALIVLRHASVLNPKDEFVNANMAFALLALGRVSQAEQLCESLKSRKGQEARHVILAMAFHMQRKQADAQRELVELMKMDGDDAATSYAMIFAVWGQKREAIKWLTVALKRRDAELQGIRVDWPFDSLRNEPEFKALERELNFPP